MNISDKITKYLLSEEAGISDEVLLVTSNIRKEIEAIEPHCHQIRTHPSKGYQYEAIDCFVNIFGERVLVRAIVRFAKDKMRLTVYLCLGSVGENLIMTVK